MHGQLVVERKFLGHVADERFDAVGFARHVVPGDCGPALRRLEQAAQHANDGGFAGAIWAEETEDGTLTDRETDVIDGGEAAEAPGQVLTEDHWWNPSI